MYYIIYNILTAGQKKYNNLFNTYINRCNVAIVIFDITNF